MRTLKGWSGIIATVVVWALAARALDNPAMLPSPLRVVERLIRDLGSHHLWSATEYTLAAAGGGAILGVCVALPLAFIMYKCPALERALNPVIAISQAVPSVATAPLLVVWVGYGLESISVLCGLMIFFPMFTTTLLGLKSIPQDVMEAARLDGAERFSLLRNIEAPLSLPALLTGLRTGFTLAMIGAVVGEYVMGGKGLGNRIQLQASAADMSGLFATVAVLCLWAALASQAITTIEKHSAIMRSLTPER